MGNWTGWRGVLRVNEDAGTLGFWCPACQELHVYEVPRWTFNGNYEKPTFRPSLLIRSGHHVPNHPRLPDGSCHWCVSAAKRGVPTICRVCHLFVTDGVITYCGDCSHMLRGKTAPVVVHHGDE